MSAGRVGEAGEVRRIGLEARREARGFGDYLEAARQAARRQVAEGAARRAADGAGAPGAEAAASPGAALSRRRAQAGALDGELALRRHGLGGEERACEERRVEAAPSRGPAGGAPRDAAAPGAAPRAADLAAAVEKLAVAVQRRDQALEPELRLDLGGRLSVRLARGQRGVEMVFAAEAPMAQLVEAELPAVLVRLRERGIAVSRAEVQVARGTASSGGAAAAGRGAAPARRGPTPGHPGGVAGSTVGRGLAR